MALKAALSSPLLACECVPFLPVVFEILLFPCLTALTKMFVVAHKPALYYALLQGKMQPALTGGADTEEV